MDPVLTPIDSGDLTLSCKNSSLQQQLFQAIRSKVVSHLWPLGGKLPSTRKLALELSISRNTVIAAYEQLVAEGYLESRPGSGFFVAVELPEHYLNVKDRSPKSPAPSACRERPLLNQPFSPGIPDLAQFPIEKWQRFLQRHSGRLSLLGCQDVQGSMALRSAIADYLATSRSVSCSPSQIVVTSGAQQALYIASRVILQSGDVLLMEQPGYTQMSKILDLNRVQVEPLCVRQHQGFDLQQVFSSRAKALYITPSNQYPMGTTLNTEQRLALIQWAVVSKSWIIEDDYDSEFQFAHRPYTSLQGLASDVGGANRVIYIGSFSKVMFNGLRLGYMVVPESTVEQCLVVKDAMGGDTPTHTQEALADFIREGDLLRHIRKMRRLYQHKHALTCQSINRHFSPQVEVISQAAGLHVTLSWFCSVDEAEFVSQAAANGLVIRALSYYEDSAVKQGITRDWGGVVLGFGNVALDDIESNIAKLARIFDSLMAKA
ncbi:PLP-dependent aminotransferase family protein [Vibrio sinaloensis]